MWENAGFNNLVRNISSRSGIWQCFHYINHSAGEFDQPVFQIIFSFSHTKMFEKQSMSIIGSRESLALIFFSSLLQKKNLQDDTVTFKN